MVAPGPRVLEDGRAHGGGEVEPGAARPVQVDGGDDAEALRVALEAVGEAEALTGHPVEHLLAEVPERRVAEVVGQRGRLDDVGVAATQLRHQRVAGHPLGDRPGDLRHLQAVGQPVVHEQARPGGAHHLRDAREAGEERRSGDPVAVDAERAGRQAHPRLGDPRPPRRSRLVVHAAQAIPPEPDGPPPRPHTCGRDRGARRRRWARGPGAGRRMRGPRVDDHAGRPHPARPVAGDVRRLARRAPRRPAPARRHGTGPGRRRHVPRARPHVRRARRARAPPHLDTRLAAAGVRIVTGRVVGTVDGGRAVLLADGARLDADVLVDAGGHRAPLSNHADRRRAPHGYESGSHSGRHGDAAGVGRAPHGDHADLLADGTGRRGSGGADSGGRTALAGGRRARVAAEQTAYGVVVDAATAAPLVGPGEALFMDWRPDHGEPGWPTFLYAIPLGGDAVLLEETSLARRPGLPLPVLRRRLDARLARHGITAPADARVERVRFPVDRPRHATPGVLGFGAAAPLMHPATGFSVADALRLAPVVAEALAHRRRARRAASGLARPRPRRPPPAADRPGSPAAHAARDRAGLLRDLLRPPRTTPPRLPLRPRRPRRAPRRHGCSVQPRRRRLRRRLIDPAFRGPAPALPR